MCDGWEDGVRQKVEALPAKRPLRELEHDAAAILHERDDLGVDAVEPFARAARAGLESLLRDALGEERVDKVRAEDRLGLLAAIDRSVGSQAARRSGT